MIMLMARSIRHGRAVRPSDLDRLGCTGDTHQLYCRRCNGTYSADAADYRFWGTDRPFKCCGVNNWLVERSQRRPPMPQYALTAHDLR